MESKVSEESPSRGRDGDNGISPETKEPAERNATVGTMEPPPAGKEANDEAWLCPICFMWFDMPVSPPCKHNFCAGCLKSVVKAAAQRQRRSGDTRASGPVCPICREPFSPEAVTPDSRIFEEMLKATVRCPNGGECSAQFCPLRWKKHQEECPSAIVQCTHHAVGCVWKGARRELPAHVESCAYEKIKGLVPRVSAALKQIHTQVHHLEARIMAQNAAVANTRAVLVHQRQRGAVFPVVYALLWRPADWRRYSCPSPGDVLSNVTLICVAPILFICLWGAGLFGGSSGPALGERAVCLGGLAILVFVLFLEYDNGSPWHEVQSPCRLQGGLAVGKVLLENTAKLVVYCAIKGLPPWKRAPAVVLLLAPLFYPPVVEAVHRFQVQVKNAQNQAQRAHAQTPLTPPEPLVPSAVKVHATVVHGVVRAVAMLVCGHEAVLAGEASAKLSVIVISAVLGPAALEALLERLWVTMSAGIALDDKERLKTRHNTIFGEMKSPLPSMMGGRARGLIAAACIVVLAATVSYFRDSLQMIVYGRLLLSALDHAHFRLELHVGRLVMRSLRQTRTSQDADPAGNRSRDLLRSRLFLLWTVVGSVFFVLVLFIS